MDLLAKIAAERPDFVKLGEAARLFPVLDENLKERRAASVLLASFRIIDALADALLRRIGRPLGKRASVTCFTEVVLRSEDANAPKVPTGRAHNGQHRPRRLVGACGV